MKKRYLVMAAFLAVAAFAAGHAAAAEVELRVTPEAQAEMANLGSVLTLAPETLSSG